jgi:hypothetical protein
VGVIENRPNLLDSAHVGECMRAGIFTCDPHAPLRELAATMSSLRIHALALRAASGQPLPFITALELMAGIAFSWASDRRPRSRHRGHCLAHADAARGG